MKHNSIKTIVVLFLFFMLISPLMAQRQTGSLQGKVVDEENQSLPGVTLTLRSPSLLGTQDFITTDQGSFRFLALPPGVYNLTCELDGFTTITRSEIIISVGKTTTINLVLKQSALSEELTITAPSPTVDVKSTKAAVNYTKDLLENIPVGRSISAFIASAPGLVTADFGMSNAYGAAATNNTFMVDGLDFTNPAVGANDIMHDIDSVEEIEIEVGGHPAEIGRTAGGFVNIVTSSGGNSFHGRLNAYFFTPSMVDNNATEHELRALGFGRPTRTFRSQDFTGTLGGPIVKDKLWFYLVGQYATTESEIRNFPEDRRTKQWQAQAKLTFQITQKIKLTGLVSSFEYVNPNEYANPYFTLDASQRYTRPINYINAQVNWILGPNAFLDIRAMVMKMESNWLTRDDIEIQKNYSSYDYATGFYSGTSGYNGYSEYYKRGRMDFNASFTWFKDDFLGGNHEIKIGTEYERSWNYTDNWMPVPIQNYTWNGSPYSWGSGLPEGMFLAFANDDQEGTNDWKTYIDYIGAFIQDSWTIKNRLTLNLGVRYEFQTGSVPATVAEEVPYWLWLDPDFFARKEFPAVKDLFTTHVFTPRLGLTYDIFGNGKTIAKASFCRYNERLLHLHIEWMNLAAHGRQWWYWWDSNLNEEYDQDDFYQLLGAQARFEFDPHLMIDPNLKAPYWNEWIVGFEQELMKDFRLGFRFIYKLQPVVMEDVEKDGDQNWSIQRTVTDPGYDGRFGTADDQQLTYYDRSAPIWYYISTNPEEASRKYRALQLTFDKRMSNKWQLSGSITYSKTYGTMGGDYYSSGGYTGAFDSPNYLINREGPTYSDRPLIFRVMATYILPFRIILSGYFTYQSGRPWTRTVDIWAPNQSSYIRINAEPQGSRRYRATNNLDLRLEKEFSYKDKVRLGLFVDISNALNTFYYIIGDGGYHGMIHADGSFAQDYYWQRIVGTSGARRVRVGVRITF